MITILRVLEKGCSLHDVLEAVRPHLDLSFETILAHINTIFVLATRQGAIMQNERYLRLKVSVGVWAKEISSTNGLSFYVLLTSTSALPCQFVSGWVWG